jgi:hypothetical protein
MGQVPFISEKNFVSLLRVRKLTVEYSFWLVVQPYFSEGIAYLLANDVHIITFFLGIN